MAGARGFAPAPDREELEQATLAELHALAAERGLDRYRLMRKEALVDALASGERLGEERYEPPPAVEDEDPAADAPPAAETAGAPKAAPKVNTEVFDSFDDAVESVRDAIGEEVQLVIGDADVEHWVEISGELAELGEREGRATFTVGRAGRFALDERHFVSGERWTVDTGDYWRITIEQGRIRLALSDLR